MALWVLPEVTMRFYENPHGKQKPPHPMADVIVQWFTEQGIVPPEIKGAAVRHHYIGDEDLLEDLNEYLRPHGYYVDLDTPHRGFIDKIPEGARLEELSAPESFPADISDRYMTWLRLFLVGNMRQADALYDPEFLAFFQRGLSDSYPHFPHVLKLWRGVRVPPRVVKAGKLPLAEEFPTISCTDSRDVAWQFANMGIIGGGMFPGEKLYPYLLQVTAPRTTMVYHYSFMPIFDLGFNQVDIRELERQQEVILVKHYRIVQEVVPVE